ncbi:hypothetical protein CF386_08595 [Paraphotobacterium marinum]|uniref:Tail specific protease domain-containing protein n=1 Tax=Paraphotobacterium marinum TaxID=1755811 RepID=A0A220VFK0_9GAMM|nr:S41 family peptidase [Paraphotobacterium marinum]ASK79119.1 hypothetical protein CF386_08595 [Paraphotobacterium marinum]
MSSYFDTPVSHIRNFILVFILFFSVNLFAFPGYWKQQALTDMERIHSTIKKYDPYKYSKLQAPYQSWLKNGISISKNDINMVVDKVSYFEFLEKYVKRYDIQHIFLIYRKPYRSHHKKNYDPTIRELSDNITWIKIPTFQRSSKSKEKKLKKKFKELDLIMPKLRNNKNIVIDLRGNRGGSGHDARGLVVSLYGREYLLSRGKSFYWNQKRSYITTISPPVIEKYLDDSSYIGRKANNAIIHNKKFFKYSVWPYYPYKPQINMVDNPVKGNIYILIDKECASMCYLLARVWGTLPNVHLLGEPPRSNMGLITNPVVFKISKYAKLGLASSLITSPKSLVNKDLKFDYILHEDMKNDQVVIPWVRSIIQN